MALVYLVKSTLSFSRQLPTRSSLSIVGALLLLYGLVGFFSAALSATGGLRWLKGDHEFPMGVVSGALFDDEGTLYCPSIPFGRIQIYDHKMRYLRGWFVQAFGGDFRIRVTPEKNIEVVTARETMRYVFDSRGALLSSSSYEPKSYADYSNWTGQVVLVPTPFYLWPMFHPFGSWAVGVLGMAIIAILKIVKVKEIT
jgi:hypothetical protein